MARPRALPEDAVLVELREHHTYEEIATLFGVTKSAVAWRFRAMGQTRTQQSYKHLRPWRVKAEHEHAHPSLMLRLYGRRAAELELAVAQQRMLDRWLHELHAADAVVGYDPDFPPNPASPRSGGWFYVQRREGVDLGLIREPSAEAKPAKVAVRRKAAS